MKTITALMIISICIAFSTYSSGQESYKIKGKVTAGKTGESLPGVHVVIKNNVYGTITGNDGNFELATKVKPPFYIEISYVGFENREIYVSNVDSFLTIKLNEQNLLGQEVVVSSSRIEESILRAPVSVEKMNTRDLRLIPAANFYDGLYQLKGVDMNVHGLIFRLPNARGFNDNTNYRMNQIIDGMENISPGLSFSAGNIFGLSQMDVESVELVVGASSALYGPGGMNGTLVMKSKDPFRYQGLSISLQSGIMNINEKTLDNPTPMYDINLRYAKAFSNRMAIKITGSYLNATDWQASDLRDRTNLNNPGLTRSTNPGYDGVNTYGDEGLVSVNLKDVATQVIDGIANSQGIVPGTQEYENLYQNAIQYFPDQLVTRTGWLESDLAEDKTKNIRLGGSLNYFITERTQAIVQTNYAQGTSVYTAQNRFGARDFYIFSGKIEINNPNYYVRAWGVSENSGSSYDIGGTALLINEAWKPSEIWFQDYLTAYTQTALISGDMNTAHQFARLVSDNRDPVTNNVFDNTKPARPVNGTPEFENLFRSISGKAIAEGGARVFDQSKMFQAEGMYNFTDIIKIMEMQIGMSQRLYIIDSNGSIFADEPGNPITINQFGTFIQINKNLLNDYLRLTGAFRLDKNENFEAQYTPRFSAILFLDKKKEHSLRGTYQTAYRFPSVSDQWIDIYTGIFRTIGGMPEVHEKYNFNTIPLYPLSGRNPVSDKPITENGPITIPGLKPEKVASSEIGYKGLFLGKKLFFDAYAYYNKYIGFEASQLLAQLAVDAGTEKDQLFQTYFTTDEPVSSFGWAAGLDYLTPVGILIRGNVAKNKLIEGIDSPGVEARFNTPEYRANLSVGHFAILPNLGFNINFHWQSKFYWESSFGAADIPAYTTLDAQFSYKFSAINTTFKLGGSNILNKYYTSSFGSAQIGGLYYFSLIYENIFDYPERDKN